MTEKTDLNMNTQNFHACLVQLEGKGVMITGRSGGGKTSLAMGLLESFENKGKQAFLVCDDQVILHAANGCLTGSVPRSIAGKAEIFGFGIIDVAHVISSQIDLLVQLHRDDKIERMPNPAYSDLMGITVPMIFVPERHENQAKRIVIAKLTTLLDKAEF